ncbi:FKBP-type peptidyl-prolyl cis-trans isomerase [Candidatus Gracilibacteria bacterium]|nr:FKBP-type peptidyl-prolyl cis-trans isomerase [Candidatus Gracilibacteria bacterium]
MRILIASALLLTLASCNLPGSTNDSEKIPPAKVPVQTTPVTTTKSANTGSVVSLNYTLRTDSPTGPIQETTIESVAISSGLYKTGSTYQPFQVVLGQGQVIKGFESGLMGVKIGDKKTIKVIPSEGYGRPVIVPKEQIAPEFSLTRDKKLFENILTQTIEKSQFPAEMQTKVMEAKVGDTLTGANNSVAKVASVSSGSITLAIENTGNPFYKKEVKLGAVASTAGADFKVVSIEGNNVTLQITNKESPFFGKTFAVGESATPKNGNKITIQAISDTSVTILADHPFMAKDLYFDVEITDIQ